MGFHQQVTLKAVSPEFTAALKQRTLSGTWNAVLSYKSGKTEIFNFANEATMRRELISRSKHQVKFIRAITDARTSGVQQAREEMLKTNPRKSDHVKIPVQPQPSPLARAGFTEEEEEAIKRACCETAAQLRPWFVNVPENWTIVFRYLSDHGLPSTAIRIGESMDYLYANNHLIRAQRKRGDEPVRPYNSPSPGEAMTEEEVAKAMDFTELRDLVHQQQRKQKQ